MAKDFKAALRAKWREFEQGGPVITRKNVEQGGGYTSVDAALTANEAGRASAGASCHVGPTTPKPACPA